MAQERKRSRRRFSDEFKRDAAALVIDTGPKQAPTDPIDGTSSRQWRRA